MKYFCDNEDNLKSLKVVLDSWLGTPYRHWCGVKGLGCDCIHLVARVYEEMGYGPFEISPYAKDWNLHRTDELLMDNLPRQLPCDVLSPDHSPRNSDVIMYRFGKVVSHSGIYFNEEVYQSLTRMRVEKIHWKQKPWFKRMECILRVKSL